MEVTNQFRTLFGGTKTEQSAPTAGTANAEAADVYGTGGSLPNYPPDSVTIGGQTKTAGAAGSESGSSPPPAEDPLNAILSSSSSGGDTLELSKKSDSGTGKTGAEDMDAQLQQALGTA